MRKKDIKIISGGIGWLIFLQKEESIKKVGTT